MEHLFTVIPIDIVKLVAAFIVGGLIGAEREFHDKAAGLRTIILISVGACLFTIFSVKIAANMDPGRVAAQIVTGIGFLGAGVILHRRGQVRGLTTASTIWIAAALGMGIGIGYVLFTVVAAVLALFVLWVLPRFERILEDARAFRVYQVITALDLKKPPKLARMFAQAGLRVSQERTVKRGSEMVSTWFVSGPPAAHEKVVLEMLADSEIKELDY